MKFLGTCTNGPQRCIMAKTGKIEFFAQSVHINSFLKPRPSVKFMPEYVARLKPQSTNHPSSSTVKRCVPFIDAINLGYIIPLWSDVFVRASNGELSIQFPDALQMDQSLSEHSHEQIKGHPLSDKPYGNMPLKWHNPWGIKTPKGWSVLITSPLNRLETRFKIFDGVVDTDEYYNKVNFPFVWTGGDGEFLIPAGTPLAQVIPFERSKIDFAIVEEDEAKIRSVQSRLGSVFRNAYRKMFWHKRSDLDS